MGGGMAAGGPGGMAAGGLGEALAAGRSAIGSRGWARTKRQSPARRAHNSITLLTSKLSLVSCCTILWFSFRELVWGMARLQVEVSFIIHLLWGGGGHRFRFHGGISLSHTLSLGGQACMWLGLWGCAARRHSSRGQGLEFCGGPAGLGGRGGRAGRCFRRQLRSPRSFRRRGPRRLSVLDSGGGPTRS